MAIEKYSGVASANVSKVDGVTLLNIEKVDGVDRVSVFKFQVDTSLGDGLAEYRLPFSNQGSFPYNCTVSWGDGTSDTITSYLDPAVDHTYSTGGVYDITIVGVIGNFQTGDGAVNADKDKISDVLSWGTNFTQGTFNGCTGLTVLSATGFPTNINAGLFNGCNSLTSGFANWVLDASINLIFNSCSSFVGADIDTWDVSSTTDMSSPFSGVASSFNPDLSSWNTGSATSMVSMFQNRPSFNQDLGSWDVSQVRQFDQMFRGANSFTNGGVSGVGVGLDQWQITNALDLQGMFRQASNFNCYIGSWNLNGVTDINRMFNGASSFDQDLSGWDTSTVRDMGGLFESTPFNQDISGWNTSQVREMEYIFNGASQFNQPIGSWNVSEVTTFNRSFVNADSFNQPLNSWNVAKVTDMTAMFQNNDAFNQPINSWNTTLCSNMSSMFSGASVFNQDIGSWNTTGTNLSGMFSGATAYNNGGVGGVGAGIDQWDVTANSSLIRMFDTASSFNQYIGTWNVSGVQNMQEMFDRASAFNQDIGGWNVSACTTFTNMFNRASAFNQDIGGWVFNASLTSLSGMFAVASSFNNGGVGGVGTGIDQWNVSNITNFGYMFTNCPFNEYIGSWNVSSGQTFTNFSEGAAATFDQNLSTWDLNSATNMSNAFPSMSDANAAASLVGWEANVPNTGVNASVVFGSRTLSQTTYPNAKAAYDRLLATVNIKSSGTNTSIATSKLIDTGADFVTDGVAIGDYVKNTTSDEQALVTAIDSATQLSLSSDIFKGTSASYEVGFGYGWVITGITWV